jgi:hypothetical protein
MRLFDTRREFLKRTATVVAVGLADRAVAGNVEPPRHFICVTCGTQFSASASEPEHCPICEDERQYVGHDGQKWTTLDAYRKTHKNILTEEERNLHSILPQPKAGIGQRAFLVRTPAGNLLWDCVSPLDDETVTRVKALSGIAAIAISHPHYYTSMVEWSQAFGDIPIYLHKADAKWVMRPDSHIEFWDGEVKSLFGGLTLAHTGGHFDGFQVLHWPAGAGGKGVLLAGDQPAVCQDRRWVTFMYSYPNMIPLGPAAIRKIVERVKPFAFDRLYSAFAEQVIKTGAKSAVERSADRYLRAIRA